MKRLCVTILDLITRGPEKRPYSRIMNANYASIMPQAIAVWCEEMGHDVRYVCYTGNEEITDHLADETDVLFVGAFTLSAHAAYAISNIYRKKGAVTVLGGPHARCYPEDAAKYFDYVLGFTDKPEVEEILRERAPHRPFGRLISALGQPQYMPGVRERWKFIDATLAKAPTLKLVPMIGSLGCPYTCSFCIDSTVKYQPLGFDQIKEDLRFLVTKMKKPVVGWHDPNFGIRFDDYMGAIEDAVAPGQVEGVAESSLSILTEENLKRMNKNGFIGMLPGIESWYDYGNKSKTTRSSGLEKVKTISDQINTILRYIPFVQTNFILGLDCDEGPEPFELTKKFMEITPGAFPAFSLFTSYGKAAPMNLDLQRAGRVLPFPFHFLDSNHAMNIRPLNYEWKEFYDLTHDLTKFALSSKTIFRRFNSNKHRTVKWLNLVRGAASNRTKYMATISNLLSTDLTVRRFFEGESRVLPEFYKNMIQESMGPLWEDLPDGGMEHDQNAYLNSQPKKDPVVVEEPIQMAAS